MRDYYNEAATEQLDDPSYKVIGNDVWLQMLPIDKSARLKRTPWKFTLSVHAEDVPKAWNIVVGELIKESGHMTKVATLQAIDEVFGQDPASLSAEFAEQAGKMMTIRAMSVYNSEHYGKILRAIEQRFKDAGVRPGVEIANERKIPGSLYIFYRNDKNLKGEYISADRLLGFDKDQRFNPSRAIDPYEHLDFTR